MESEGQDDEQGYVDLVSIDMEEDYTKVALSSVFQRVFSLLAALDWEGVDVGTQDVFNS